MSNIIETLYTLAAGRRPTGRNPGELFINMADRIIGYTDANRVPVDLPGRPAVGTVAPPDPMPGDLWFDTTAPGALKIYRGATLGWITAGGGAAGAATHIGDTPPAAPVAGQLWFKTIAPIGLFVWLNDGDSTQWVQTQGGGSFSQRGFQSIDATGIGTLRFDQVPPEASSLELMLNNLVWPASALRLNLSNAPTQGHNTVGQVAGAAYAAPWSASGATFTEITLGTHTAAMGKISLERFGDNVANEGWFLSGTFQTINTRLTTSGRVIRNAGSALTFWQLSLASGGPFTSGSVGMRWRT